MSRGFTCLHVYDTPHNIAQPPRLSDIVQKLSYRIEILIIVLIKVSI